MATSAVPLLIDALVSEARTALPSLNVFDGFGVTDDPGDFLMVGVGDPDSSDLAASAETTQEWATVGPDAQRDEEGNLTCTALSWNGNNDQKQARDAVYAITAAVENLLRANPSLGVPQLLWTSFGSETQLDQNQNEDGAEARVMFQIHFRARL